MYVVLSGGSAVNKLAIFALVIVSLLGMTLAATMGVFYANGSDAAVADQNETEALASLEGSYALLPEEEAELDNLAERTHSSLEAKKEAKADLSESSATLKLQEIRDAYISFPQAFEEVVIKYQRGYQCEGEVACVGPESEIVISRAWAKSATREEIDITLARQHAHLAITRAWGSHYEAVQDIESVIPTCTVEQDSEVYAEATKTEAQILPEPQEISLTALTDVIVSVMTGQKDDSNIYPVQFHTPEQIRIAEQVTLGERPEIVVPVASLACKN